MESEEKCERAMEKYPILLKPAYQHYLWGGRHFASRYGRDIGEEICAESWEISDRQEGMGIVLNGKYKGMTLHELVESQGEALVGTGGEHFPVLIKLIDAAQPLSVQVHPNEEAAKRLGSEPKTEMWFVLAAEQGGVLYVGLKEGVTADEFEAALDRGEVQKLLLKHAVKPGDFFLIPAGTLHAIGQGCMVYEVQQNSDTTYRVWDWNRVDTDGKPRELHRKEAMASIHFDAKLPISQPKVEVKRENGHLDLLISDSRFVVKRLNFSGEWEIEKGEESYLTLFVTKGECTVEVEGGKEALTVGQSCLIPAVCRQIKLHSDGGAKLILTTQGS